MSRYATGTDVSPEDSRAEIERILKRYGATGFSYGYRGDRAALAFEIHGRQFRLNINLPRAEEYATDSRGRRVEPRQRDAARDREERRRWRVLVLWLKGALEAVDSEVTTVDEVLCGYQVLPSGETVREWLNPQFEYVYQTGRMPALVPGLDVPALPAGKGV